MAVLKTENLQFAYSLGMPNEVKVLNGINVEIEKGEFVGLIGPTGCGKSTFISHLNGLLRPTEGKVFLNDVDIWETTTDMRNVRFKVGLSFQYPEYQLFEETVYKDIAFGPKNMGLLENEIKERVLEAAKFCQVEDRLLQVSPFELSGGQKRRVAIAGVMAMRPQVLVLDEPAAGLDPEGRKSILEGVKRYQQEEGATVILVSHSMEDITRYADKVMVMQGGNIAMFDTTEQVFSRADELLSMGLAVPQITQIFLKLKEMGIDIVTDVYTMDYAVKELKKYKNRKTEGDA
jgi:ABC-type cobalt transport system, ATPase component